VCGDAGGSPLLVRAPAAVGLNRGVRVHLFSAKRYEREPFETANVAHGHELEFLEPRLEPRTARLATGADAVCVFVNDLIDADVVSQLSELGVRAMALRCAGYNNVDLVAAQRAGIPVVRVPAYSPEAVAEHTLALILSLDRQIHRAYQRVREANFSLDGLLGEGLHGKTAAVVGTGRVGAHVARLLLAFGCIVLAHDPFPDDGLVAAGARYVELRELYARADVLALTCPLTPETFHLVDEVSIEVMRPGVMLVNTGRGALIDTAAVIDALKTGHIGSLAIDVYEEEGSLFFEDRSQQMLEDDVFARLLTFPNVLITAHQGFFTSGALAAIAETTLTNLDDLAAGRPCPNLVSAPS
jgi:D-lactate dehydrogenase